MIIRDMMPSFELYQPTSVEGALDLIGQFGQDGWVMAGGNDSLDWFKDRVKRPKAVIELGGIDELKGIKETADGLEIGALATLAEVSSNPIVKQKFGVLAAAAGHVASPQIRNTGTIGGNVSQDTRCWYYRSGLPCYRAGGNTCFSDTPQGMNREHALFETDRCVAVSPSDTATALVALNASMVIRNSGGERVVPAEEFFIGPATDITRMTQLEHGKDILTAIRIPNDFAGGRFYFEKVADRGVWDFPLVNVAAAMTVNGDIVEKARVVCGAVQCTPKLLPVVEDVIKGKKVDAALAELAGKSSSRGAVALNYNDFKIPLMEKLVTRAVRDAA